MKLAKFGIIWNALFFVWDAFWAGVRVAEHEWGLALLDVVLAILMLLLLRLSLGSYRRFRELK